MSPEPRLVGQLVAEEHLRGLAKRASRAGHYLGELEVQLAAAAAAAVVYGLVSVEDAARLTGRSRRQIRRWVRLGLHQKA